jgi:serine/threonine protein kinase
VDALEGDFSKRTGKIKANNFAKTGIIVEVLEPVGLSSIMVGGAGLKNAGCLCHKSTRKKVDLQTNHSGKNSGNLEKRRDDRSELPQENLVNGQGSSPSAENSAISSDEATQVDPHTSGQTPEGTGSLPEFDMELEQDQELPLPQRNQVGAIIDRKYELLSLLGTGGMSAVYKARHAFMRNTVAVKLMHPRLLTDTQSIKRFQQEARAASRLKHPNAITVYEFGISGGQPYLVMDYLEGLSCADLIKKEGKIDVERCLSIFIQACDALADAHERGIIHRDLKPSNIMIVKENGDDCVVKVVDFGIAKIVSEGGESLKLTNTGEVFGSPLYMSPEQCMGQTLDPRSDIYSMGCLMYEALTGKTPFTGKNVLETILKQTSEPPPGLGAVDGDVRVVQKLDAIVLKCLAKAPEQRYQSMNELKADLESAAQSAGTGWQPLATFGRKAAQVERSLARQMGRSHKSGVLLFAGSALAILLAICAISSWLLWPVYGPGRDPSLQSRELHLKPILTGRGVVDTSKSPLGKFALSLMNNPSESEGLIRSRYVLANKFKNAGDYLKAVIVYANARDLIVKYKQEGTLLCAQIIISEAECRLLLGESDKSVLGYCQYGLDWLSKLNATESRDGLRLYVLIGRIRASMGDKAGAQEAFDKVLYLLGRVWQDCSDEDLAFAQSYAADFYRRSGNFEQARILYNNALVHWQSLSRFENALYNLGVVQSQLSSVLSAEKEFTGAEDYLNQANTNISEGGGSSIDKAKLEFLQSDLKLAQGKFIDYVVTRAQARKLWNKDGRNTGGAFSGDR